MISPVLAANLNPIDWIKSAANWINPFEWVKDKLVNLYTSFAAFLERMINDPWHLSTTDFVRFLADNFLGLALFLASSCLILLIVAYLIPSLTVPIARTIRNSVIVLLFSTLWFGACEYFIATGTQMTRGVELMFNDDPDKAGKLMDLPVIENPIGAIIAILALGVFGAFLLLIVLGYQLAIVWAMPSPPALLTIRDLGDTPRRIFSWTISVGVVGGMIFGRPLTVLCLKLSTLASQNIDSLNNWIGQVVLLILSLILAIIANLALIVKTHNYAAKVSGQVKTKTLIQNTVKTVQKPVNKINIARVQVMHMSGLTSRRSINPSASSNNATFNPPKFDDF